MFGQRRRSPQPSSVGRVSRRQPSGCQDRRTCRRPVGRRAARGSGEGHSKSRFAAPRDVAAQPLSRRSVPVTDWGDPSASTSTISRTPGGRQLHGWLCGGDHRSRISPTGRLHAWRRLACRSCTRISRRSTSASSSMAGSTRVELVGVAEQLVEAEPFRERRWALLMRTLYLAGRQRDALRAFQRASRSVARRTRAQPGCRAVGGRTFDPESGAATRVAARQREGARTGRATTRSPRRPR